MRSTFSLGRYKSLTDKYVKHTKNDKNGRSASAIFNRAKFVICRQRMLSLNNRHPKPKRGAGKGFVDDSFHVGMSRGYSTIAPITLSYASKLSEFGPFFKNSGLCEFIGSSSLTYWKGRTVVFPFSITNSIAWYLDLIPVEVKKLFKSVEHVFVALPSYVASFMTLQNFSIYREGYRGYVNPKLLNLDDQLFRLKLPTKVPMPTKNDILNAKLTEETHPGIVTRTMTYLKNKSLVKKKTDIKKIDIIRKAVHDVYHNWTNISNGKFQDTAGTYCLGSREKIHVLDVGDLIKLRTVWIPETIDIIVGSTWFETLKEQWGKRNLFSSEIWLGHADNHQRFHRRTEIDIKFKYSYEFDGKEWETGVVSEVIVYAFNIVRGCFKGGVATDNHFKFIMDTLVNKRLILHNGNTFFINNGMPSGHAWTSLINSLVNWIIWTSTIKNCPYVPPEVKKDYNLKIQGDDVDLDCNFIINEGDVKKIIEWMLINFNYKATYRNNNVIKNKDVTGLTNSSFLKRVTNAFGLIDTPVDHIWEKMLCGPEYSGCRNDRMVYLRRRLNDLAIFDSKNVEQLALYYAYIKHYPKVSAKAERSLYALFFVLTNGFTISLRERWEIFCYVFSVRADDLIKTRDYYITYFGQLYEKNYLTYDDSKEYVDYWKERPRSINVGDIIRNQERLPLTYGKDMFKVLHGFKRKKKSWRKNKIMKGIKKLIAF